MTDNILITGIPRSGTSYLCSLLNNIPNTVVINEPEEIFQILRPGSQWNLPDFYASIREAVVNNIPIPNKIVNNRFIEDTNLVDERNYYSPKVDNSRFLLGTKNTLLYLTCLEKIHDQDADMKVVSCVRHPFDTFASWKNVTFPHIKYAAPEFLLGYATTDERYKLSQIISVTDIAERRALLWSHLAERVAANADNSMIVKYEDLVTRPSDTMKKIFEYAGRPSDSIPPIPASSVRKHPDSLDQHELECITHICRDTAIKHGYTLQY